MYRYRAFGLNIDSEILLPELCAGGEGSPDLIIRRRAINPHALGLIDRRTRLLSVVPNVGRFLCDRGRELVVDPVGGVADDELRVTILGPVFTFILRQRHLNVLHASCVLVDGAAIAFIGPCGAGKSTMAQAFYEAGFPLISDDVTALRHENGHISVMPSYPQVKLNDDSANALVGPAAHLGALYEGATKRVHFPRKAFPSEPIPLRHIYVLGVGDEISRTRLDPQRSFAALIANSRIGYMRDIPHYMRVQFEQCSEVARAIPMSLLTRRRSFEEVDSVVSFLAQDVISGQAHVVAE